MHSRIPDRREADDAHRVAVDVAERALLEEGDAVADPWSRELSSKDPWTSSRITVTLNTPPQIPTRAFPPSPFETPSPRTHPSPGVVRPTVAPSFMPPTQRTHSRTRSNLLPAIDLSHGPTMTHRRAASSTSLSNPPLRTPDVARGDLPLPRSTTSKRQAGMPTLAEITAYYATKRTSPIAAAPIPAAAQPATSRRPLPTGGLAMLKRCSLSSETSTSTEYSSAESDPGPQTPPAAESVPRHRDLDGKLASSASERRESASRLPGFLRRGSEAGMEEGKATTTTMTGGYNALAMALARHRRTVSASTRESLTMPPLMGTPRRSSSLDATTTTTNVTRTPGIHVTPPSNTIPPSPKFALPPTPPTPPRHHAHRKPGIPHTTTLHTSLAVPGLRVTPPTASAGEDDTSPLLRLEAEIAATRASSEEEGKRQERSERMRRMLGMRTGGK